MPVYQVHHSAGSLDDAQRAEIAGRITEIHVANTGAPSIFVNVVFTEIPRGATFTGGKRSNLSVIVGSIRRGRPIETRRQIIEELAQMWSSITGQGAEEVLLYVDEADPRSAMEMGLFFPEAGEEGPWLEANGERLRALGVLP